jgi:hypothetical protein
MLAPLLAEFLNPDNGPKPTGDWREDPQAFLLLVIAGFVIASLGHLYKSKTMVATGILMVFLATVGIPLYLHITR